MTAFETHSDKNVLTTGSIIQSRHYLRITNQSGYGKKSAPDDFSILFELRTGSAPYPA
jgi:hypothetical protein